MAEYKEGRKGSLICNLGSGPQVALITFVPTSLAELTAQ